MHYFGKKKNLAHLDETEFVSRDWDPADRQKHQIHTRRSFYFHADVSKRSNKALIYYYGHEVGFTKYLNWLRVVGIFEKKNLKLLEIITKLYKQQ